MIIQGHSATQTTVTPYTGSKIEDNKMVGKVYIILRQ